MANKSILTNIGNNIDTMLFQCNCATRADQRSVRIKCPAAAADRRPVRVVGSAVAAIRRPVGGSGGLGRRRNSMAGEDGVKSHWEFYNGIM